MATQDEISSVGNWPSESQPFGNLELLFVAGAGVPLS